MDDLVRIWYVAPQRLCNFHCSYCVSTGEWAKDEKIDWKAKDDQSHFVRTIQWIGTRSYPVGVRLATLGEPFASKFFLNQASWLVQQHMVQFVELVTNGSLLKSRLPNLAKQIDMNKLSLWMTYHPSQISLDKFIENALFAQEQYGCFVVANSLLFTDTIANVAALSRIASEVGLRFNVDIGYQPDDKHGTYAPSDEVVELSRKCDWINLAIQLGGDASVLNANLIGLDEVNGQPCSAGHNYYFIGIDGEVYPCSRYYELKNGRLGNVLSPDFELKLRSEKWRPCQATCGCSNKEDFLNLGAIDFKRRSGVPSLGWLDSISKQPDISRLACE